MNEEFFTLTNYLHNNQKITYAMEDYIEMIYRQYLEKKDLTITSLSSLLNIKKSSCSKMIRKYLFYRHEVLTNFLKALNKDKFRLEQVEKIEHFIDYNTLKNIANLKL